MVKGNKNFCKCGKFASKGKTRCKRCDEIHQLKIEVKRLKKLEVRVKGMEKMQDDLQGQLKSCRITNQDLNEKVLVLEGKKLDKEYTHWFKLLRFDEEEVMVSRIWHCNKPYLDKLLKGLAPFSDMLIVRYGTN